MASDAHAMAPRAKALYEGFDYVAFWRDRGRFHLDELEHRLVADLLPASGRRILDAGCGFGRLTDVYVDRFEHVVLLDSAWSLLEQARDRWAGRVTLVAADLRALPFAAGAFDATVIVRVLHHFDDPRPVLTGLRRASAPGARLVFNASNSRNPRRVARYLLRLERPSPFGHGPVAYDSQTFGWSPKDLEHLVAESGFTLRGFRGVGVMDKLAAHAGPLGRHVPHGTALSRPLGWLRLAPSLFGAADARDCETERPEGLFRCPSCGAGVVARGYGFACRVCDRRYPMRDGILDFRA